MELLVRHIPMRKVQKPFKDVKNLITKNFYYQIFNCQSITDQY